MPDDDLTPVQRSVLLILMAEAHEVANAYLSNDRKLELKKQRRDNLESRGLINVRREGRTLFLELADRGWRWCREQDASDVPAGAGHGGSAAYTMLAGIQRYLDRHNLSLPEFFARFDEQVIAGEVAPADIEAQIRKAYQALASGPGASVKLADLRGLLSGVARPEVDRMLVEMNRQPDVSIVPESDQKVLSERDRAAAVQIGNQDKHLITVGP